MPGPGGRGDAERAGERRADGGTDAGDLVLGLQRGDAERLVLAELVEDVGGRGDRVGAQEDRQPGLHARGDQAVRQRQVAGDVAVGARRHRGRLDLVLDHERLGGLAEVPAGLERRDVGVADVGDLREPLRRGTRSWTRSGGRTSTTAGPRANMFFARAASLRDRPNSLTASTVMPVRSTGCTANSPSGEPASPSPSSGLASYPALVRLRSVKSWVSTMIAAPLGRSPRLAFERRRVHRDQHVGGVARGQDVVVGEVDLERRDPGQRALRGADLGREVRQRHQVVAEDGRLLGEPVAGELHAVTGVAREPDDHPVELLDLLGHCAPTSLCRVTRGALGSTAAATRSIVLRVRRKLEHVPVSPSAAHLARLPTIVRAGRSPDRISPWWICDSRTSRIFS